MRTKTYGQEDGTAGSVLDVIDGDYARVTLGALRQKETLSSQLRRS